MKNYRAYRPSDADYFEAAPAHWLVIPGMLALMENNRNNRGVKERQVLSLSYGEIIVKAEEKLIGLVPMSFETYQLAMPGDIIIRCMDLQNDKVSLRTGLVSDRGIITSAYLCLSAKEGFESRYIHYFLHFLDISKAIYKLGSGLRQNLSFDDFKRLPVLKPPYSEQLLIADYLDQKSAQINQAIQIKERQIERLKERMQILIQQAVTRGLDPTVPMKDSGVDWIDRVPAHWEVKPIMAVSDVIDPNPSHRNPEYVEEGFPFISTQEFYGFDKIEIDTPRRVSEKTVAEQEARCQFQRGSLVFSRKGTIGAVRVLPEGVRLGILDSLCVINPKCHVLPSFLFWALSANYLEAQYGSILRGAALPQLSVGRVRSLKIILPPKAEQEEISSYLRRECSRLSEGLAIQGRQIVALKEYKATLINSAVTGRIKVPGVVEPDMLDIEVA
ncbi:restriction endonuclease subunit S [Pseudomonas protegens]|uniref:restriction endonuclease subunit S n=1 Tax=Pseudomonas protegens TaxID=380021 RepID=UPI001A932D13|nr:restriction endonuclease subunit S [Pseudomonas protegens]